MDTTAMGYNLELSGSADGEHATDLCTDGGYEGLCDWIETLPDEDFPSVRKFADRGEFTDTRKLVMELNEAIIAHPPSDPDTFHVADRLADLLGKGRSGETARVTS